MTPIAPISVTGLLGTVVRVATVRLTEGARRNARAEIEARAVRVREAEATSAGFGEPPILVDHGPQGIG